MSELDGGGYKKKASQLFKDERTGVFLMIVVIFIVLSFCSDAFLTGRNITNMLRQSSFYVMMGMGALCIFMTANIDLSIGSTMGLGGIITAMLAQANVPVVYIILLCVGIGLLAGSVNGFLAGILKIDSFIATMAVQIITRGVITLITNGYPVNGLSEQFTAIGTSYIWGIPTPVLITIAMCLVSWYVLNKTVFGRHALATGSNKQAAIVSGINVNRVTILAFIYGAIFYAIAGMVLTARIESGQLALGTGLEMDIIAGLVIGGVTFGGGGGSVSGGIAGILVISLIKNGMDLLNVSPFWQKIVQGIIIVAAVYVDTLRRRRANKAGSQMV